MISSSEPKERRILIVDDNPSIHEDFRKILLKSNADTAAIDKMETALFGTKSRSTAANEFQIDAASQGQDALALIRQGLEDSRPYALAFVDVRMPPGWDGIETIKRMWQEDPELQVVICTAYSDYSWFDIAEQLGTTSHLLVLRKPFDNIEVRQLAHTLTEKWLLSQSNRQKLAELEQAVQERTQEIEEQKRHLKDALDNLQQAHSQLLQADKMASIGQLAAGVAHEINNPIGFISSNLNTLGHYIDDLKQVVAAYEELLRKCHEQAPDLTETAKQVQGLRDKIDIDYIISDLGQLTAESMEGAHRVRQIVADLRDFSHVDSPDVVEEDINHLLDKTINVAWNELKYKTEVVRDYGQVPALPCYGGKLAQVFLNLLVNAAQAIEVKGTITIRTGQGDGHIWVEVTDTGCGIPPQSISRIFEPFFTTKDVGKGTGLGLHLAYSIVQAHGGKISVRSTVGKGTTFRVELPLTGPPDKVKEAQSGIAVLN
jgi:two-component system NtrC family sensor kinase